MLNPILLLASLSPHERSVMREFETFVRDQFGMSLATYLVLALEDGKAHVLDRKSAEFKSMTRWQ